MNSYRFFTPTKRAVKPGMRMMIVIISLAGIAGFFNVVPAGIVWFNSLFFSYNSEGGESEPEKLLRARIEDLESEIKELQNLPSDIANTKPIDGLVTLEAGTFLSDSMLIAAGESRGVKVGDIAVSSYGIAFGFIVETGNSWSKAVYLSRLGKNTLYRIGANKEIIFEGRGIGGNEIFVELPATVSVRVGDPLWLGAYPRFIAGFVETIDSAPGRQLQQITFRMPQAPERLHKVFIINGTI